MNMNVGIAEILKDATSSPARLIRLPEDNFSTAELTLVLEAFSAL